MNSKNFSVSVQEMVALAYAEGVADGKDNAPNNTNKEAYELVQELWPDSNAYQVLKENGMLGDKE